MIAVAGSVLARTGVGGHATAFTQYVRGFRRLGFRTHFLDVASSLESPFAETALAVLGRPHEVTLVAPDGRHLAGRAAAELEALPTGSLLINVMGYLDVEPLRSTFTRKLFLDIDPGFGQMWFDLGLADIFDGHDRYATVGTTIRDSSVPLCGIDWIPTLPPVYLPDWPVVPPAPEAPITSVVTWRGPFGPIEYEGATFGLRVHEFRRFFELPRLTGERFELALDIDPEDDRDRQALVDNGWHLVDPRRVAGTPDEYRRYIQGSKAEVMIAKNMYVATQAGWFSDRSACYLASGRPVIAQDTGFSKVLPTGDGLLAFTTLDGAAAAVEDLNSRYGEHCQAARALAEDYLSTDVVLPKLLEALL